MEPEGSLPHLRHSDLLVYVGVTIGLSHCGKSTGCGCSKLGCWGRYLVLMETSLQGTGGNSMMKSFVICKPLQILCGWWNEGVRSGRGR